MERFINNLYIVTHRFRIYMKNFKNFFTLILFTLLGFIFGSILLRRSSFLFFVSLILGFLIGGYYLYYSVSFSEYNKNKKVNEIKSKQIAKKMTQYGIGTTLLIIYMTNIGLIKQDWLIVLWTLGMIFAVALIILNAKYIIF